MKTAECTCPVGGFVSFDEVVSTFETKVFNLAFYLTSSSEIAESVLAAVFERVFYRFSEASEALTRVELFRETLDVTRQWLESTKRSGFRQSSVEDVHGAGLQGLPSATASAVTGKIVLQAGNALLRLPPEYKEVFLLRDMMGCSLDECRQVLDTPGEVLKAHLQRARLMLRRLTTNRAPVPARVPVNAKYESTDDIPEIIRGES